MRKQSQLVQVMQVLLVFCLQMIARRFEDASIVRLDRQNHLLTRFRWRQKGRLLGVTPLFAILHRILD